MKFVWRMSYKRRDERIPIQPDDDIPLVDCHAHFLEREPLRKPTHSIQSQYDFFFKKHKGQFIINSGHIYKDEHLYQFEFIKKHPGVYLTIGCLKPSDRYGMDTVNEEHPIFIDVLENFQENYVGIGEFGLDFHHAKKMSRRTEQIEYFQRVIQETEHLKKPYILHVRNATQRDVDQHNPNHEYNQRDFCNRAVTRILEEEGIEPERVQWHCFSGPQDWGKKLAKQGYYISVPSSAYGFTRWRRNIPGVPLDKLLTETDSCMQHPFKMGSFNNPANVKYSVAAIAYENKMEQLEVAEQIEKNARKFFGIK